MSAYHSVMWYAQIIPVFKIEIVNVSIDDMTNIFIDIDFIFVNIVSIFRIRFTLSIDPISYW